MTTISDLPAEVIGKIASKIPSRKRCFDKTTVAPLVDVERKKLRMQMDTIRVRIRSVLTALNASIRTGNSFSYFSDADDQYKIPDGILSKFPRSVLFESGRESDQEFAESLKTLTSSFVSDIRKIDPNTVWSIRSVSEWSVRIPLGCLDGIEYSMELEEEWQSNHVSLPGHLFTRRMLFWMEFHDDDGKKRQIRFTIGMEEDYYPMYLYLSIDHNGKCGDEGGFETMWPYVIGFLETILQLQPNTEPYVELVFEKRPVSVSLSKKLSDAILSEVARYGVVTSKHRMQYNK